MPIVRIAQSQIHSAYLRTYEKRALKEVHSAHLRTYQKRALKDVHSAHLIGSAYHGSLALRLKGYTVPI